MLSELKKLLNENQKIDWDTYFSSLSLLIASRSPCERLQVGCVLVNNKRVLSTGYNGFLPGAKHESVVRDNHEQATVHAEQNAISYAAKNGIAVEGSTAYVTHYPCINCCKILISSGVKNIHYLDDYKNDPLVSKFCNEVGVECTSLNRLYQEK